MKKTFLKQLALTLVTIILSLHMYVAMAAEGDPAPGAAGVDGNTDSTGYGGIYSLEAVKANFKETNLCIQGVKDEAKITAVIEEPLDFGGLSNEDNTGEVRNCLRISVCSKRNETLGGKTQCVSSLNKMEIEDKASLDALSNEKDIDGNHLFSVTYTPVQVFLSQSGVDMLYYYIGAIYRWGASVIGVIAVLVIVISGIQISAAGGEQAAVTSAKTRITQSLIGIVVLFMSGIILYSINPTFFTAP